MRKVILAILLGLAGCSGCSKKDGYKIVNSQKPADLGPSGVVVEFPKEGDVIEGAWTSVSGWFDPS
jgi:hypothetical protein